MKLEYSKILEIFSQKNRQNMFIVIGIIGIVLIGLSNHDFSATVNNETDELSLNEYTIQMENKVTELLQEIHGVGDVKVMITMESGEENIYAEQEKSKSDSQKNQTGVNVNENTQTTYENEIIIVSAQNNNYPLIEKTIQPSVKGVAVVCSGADDISVVSAVTNTVSVVLNVPTNRICVTKMR